MSVEKNVEEYVEFDFDEIRDEYKEFLIRLPYRVGFWISRSDQAGGDDADRMEMQMIETMIISRTQDMCKSAFMQKMMESTVAKQEDWKTWQDNVDVVPDECRKAVNILSEYVVAKELNNFCENMLEIGINVAQSFREEDASDMAGKKNFISKIISKILPEKHPEFNSPNISNRERTALIKLKKALSEGIQ